jgi:START domain
VKKVFVILVCFFLLAFVSDEPKEPWHLKKCENGISVYTRHAENSKIKELKSTFRIKTSLSSIMALLNDFESYPEWVYRCNKSYVALKISELEYIQYQSVKAPWPVENRDIVMHKKSIQDPVSKVIIQRVNGMPKYLPEVDEHVRVQLFKAVWILTPQKDGIIDVEYQLLVDPSGSIPSWLVNMAAVDGPYDTEIKMMELLKKEKYQKAKLSYIKEPE